MTSESQRLSAIHLLTAALFMVMATASGAAAHRLNVFAVAEGERIVGYAYYPGGGRARNANVRIVDESERAIAETVTDGNGEFSYAAQRRCDHIIVVESDDGHQGRWVIEARELPESLPPSEAGAGATIDSISPRAPADNRDSGGAATGPAPARIDEVLLASLIDRELSRQIRPLREQLDRFESRTRWRDVAGGIGYIVGLGGLAFFLSARRKSG